MRSVAVVMVDEDPEHTLEMAPIHDQQPAEALGASGADEALRDRLRLRRAHRCPDDLDALAAEDGVEVACELAISVADQKAQRRSSLPERPADLAGLLRHPCAGRIRRAAAQVDAPAGELDEEEHVQPLQRDRLDGEEIDGEHALGLRPQKGRPGESGALAGRAEPRLPQDLSHRCRRNGDAEAVQLTGEPLIAPARVLARQPKHQRTDLAADRRPTAASAIGPAPGDQAPMPEGFQNSDARLEMPRLPGEPES